VIALISITIIIYAIIIALICAPKTKERTNLWYATALVFGSLGYPVAILRDYVIPSTNNATIELIAHFLAAVSYRFSTYFLLMAGMSYSHFFNDSWKSRLKYIALIPCFSTFILDFIFPSKGFLSLYLLYSSIFWTVSVWAVPYGIAGVFLFIHAYYVETNLKRKRNKALICIFSIPLLGNLLVAYGATIFKINGHNMWIISLVPVVVWFSAFIYFIIKYGVLGLQIKLKQLYIYEKETHEFTSQLTGAQKEVFLLKLQGKSNREIANIRCVEISTVKTLFNQALKILDAKDIKELIQHSKYKFGINLINTKLKELNELFEQSNVTTAQKEVFLLKSEGKSNQEIAKIRGVEVSTIKSLYYQALNKLNIKDIVDLTEKI
jgi:DNA-binding CsgD family transcriptional regulator